MYKSKDIILTGFALFAMLFGAGNLIFPPMLGYEVNSAWAITILAFIITGVGFPLLGILSVSVSGSDLDSFGNRVSPIFSKIFSTLLILAIGPMLAIPRTGATAYEITFLYKGLEDPIYEYIYLISYFLIVLLFSLRANKVVELVGKILTPILLIILFLIMIRGIFLEAPILNKEFYQPFKKGFLEGYQTMDTLASIAYATLILKSIRYGRELSKKEEKSFLLKSSIVAVLALATVYGGYAIIGAKMVTLFNVKSKTQLLVELSTFLLGKTGYIILSICVAGACLTTAIGLVATVGHFFSDLLKVKYEKIVLITIAVSFVLSILGVEEIIKISVPILIFMYPIAISLIILNLLKKYIKNDYSYKGTVLFTTIIGIIECLSSLGIENKLINKIYNSLPLSEYGLAWFVPAVLGFMIFSLIFKKEKSN